jgi:hypothetical protein
MKVHMNTDYALSAARQQFTPYSGAVDSAEAPSAGLTADLREGLQSLADTMERIEKRLGASYDRLFGEGEPAGNAGAYPPMPGAQGPFLTVALGRINQLALHTEGLAARLCDRL